MKHVSTQVHNVGPRVGGLRRRERRRTYLGWPVKRDVRARDARVLGGGCLGRLASI